MLPEAVINVCSHCELESLLRGDDAKRRVDCEDGLLVSLQERGERGREGRERAKRREGGLLMIKVTT